MRITRNFYWMSFVILGVGFGISFAAYWLVHNSIRNEAQLKFEREASDAHHKIEARIRSYIDIMYGLGALFRTSTNINRAQFHRYVTGLDLPRRFPGFQTINYAEQVTTDGKARFEQKVRKDTSLDSGGYPQFAIKPPGDRPSYHVLSYQEPAAGNEATFGRDLMSAGKERASAVEQMRDSGQLVSSGRLVVVNAPKEKIVALAMRLPVYRDGEPVDTVEGRRAAFIGSLGAGFRVKELLQGVLNQETSDYLRFRLYDAGPATQYRPGQKVDLADRLLFDSKDLPETSDTSPSEEDSDFKTALPLEIAGRILEAHFVATERSIISSGDAALPYIVLGGGIVVSFLLFAIAYSLASSRSRALALAQDITQDLRRSEDDLRSYVERLRAVSRRLVEVQEAERRTLARELHDRVGQSLTAVGLNLSLIGNSFDSEANPDLADRVSDSSALVEETMGAMRNVMGELRPQGLDEYGLVAPLRTLASDYSKRTGVTVSVNESHNHGRLPRPVELAMFRIVQEALNNVTKYSKAHNVDIDFSMHDGKATLTMSDDGVGFDRANLKRTDSTSGYGLQIMQERAEAVGASFRIEATPGRGTRVTVDYVQ